MGLGAALDSAVSALQAQSKALSIISNDLANSSTIGYKSVGTSFTSLLTEETSATTYSAGGVIASATQNVGAQGLIASTSASTNVAVNGSGLFVVTADKDTSDVFFTRNGEFSADSDGYLVNNGYYLMGWTTDSDGNVESSNVNSVDGLEPININRYTTSAAGSTEVTLKANLPADADDGDSFTTSVSVYDSLGVSQDVPLTWTKSTTTENTWTLTIGNPTDPSTGDQTGTIGGSSSYTITFNTDGTLASVTDSGGNAVDQATITVSSWNDGAAAGDVTLSLGTAGSADGLTQYASGSDDPSIDIKSATTDGVAYGTLKSVSIGDDGTVTANYTNGQSLPIYKIAIATFANVDGLKAQSDNVYQMTAESGSYTLHVAGEGGAGSVVGSSLEQSTVDTADEFSRMIVAQQAYAAASQVITTSNTMFNDLMQAMR
ncbi:MAG TPA: flagellar hook protein FlgE [Dongiaceae bacterium]|jgi:flagellar hook protein FlgE|nr:flagellar hook protein FlgE [Dongiaceae bacterium]